MDDGYQNFMENHRGLVGGNCGSAGTLDYKREGEAGQEEEEEDFLNKPHVKAVLGVGAAATLCGEFFLNYFVDRLCCCIF